MRNEFHNTESTWISLLNFKGVFYRNKSMTNKLIYIGNKLSKKGSTVTSIETLGQFLQRENYIVISASSRKNRVVRMLDMVWTTLSQSRKASLVLIDTYSTTNFLYAVIIGYISRFLQLPYIPILRGGNLPNRLKKSPKLSKKLFKNAKINVAPSQYLMKAFEQAGYMNLTHIPNTIEINTYPFLLRKQPTLKLLWVRGFAELYNPTLALTILDTLLQLGHKASLCMVGPDKDGSMATCKQLAEEKNLPVLFTGKLEKTEWLRRSAAYDIFINTTNFDNTPVSVMEAMALGLPVVSTNVGGMPYLIKEGVDGILVPPNNAEAFVKALIALTENPKAAQEQALRARQKVEAFDWETVKGQWNALLSS